MSTETTPTTTPAATPATPAPAAASATPVAAPAEESAYSELDRLDKTPETPRPAPVVTAKAAEASKPADTKVETPVASTKPADAPAPTPAKELRLAYEKLKSEHANLKAEAEKLKAAPKEDPEKKLLMERAESREKELQTLEEELRFANYAKSKEYTEKFQKPFESAYANGRARAAALTATGEDGTQRAGTAEDFDAIMQIASDDQAADKANELFGTKAAAILYHREKVMELNSERFKAVEEYKVKGSERDKARAEQDTLSRANHQKQAAEINQAFRDAATAAIEKYPQWFKPADGDDPGNELLKKGFETADRAFATDPLDSRLTPEERKRVVSLHAAVRNKAAGFDRLVHANSGLKAKITELQAKLDSIIETTPGEGEVGRVKAGDVSLTANDEIDQIDKGQR